MRLLRWLAPGWPLACTGFFLGVAIVMMLPPGPMSVPLALECAALTLCPVMGGILDAYIRLEMRLDAEGEPELEEPSRFDA